MQFSVHQMVAKQCNWDLKSLCILDMMVTLFVNVINEIKINST